MSGPELPDEPTPAHARLGELLAEVRDAPIPEAHGLTHRVVHTARWQRKARHALLSLGSLSSALAEGAVTLLGLRRRDRGDH